MKKLFLIVFGIGALLCSAQQVTVTSTTPLLKGVEAAFYPNLNSSGDKLLYSDADAHGLKMLDIKSGHSATISEQAGAGLNAKWGHDGNVYYITSSINAENHLVYRTAMRYDITHNTSEVVLEAQHGAVHIETGTKGVAIGGERLTYTSSSSRGTGVYTTGSQLVITVDGKERRYTPVESHAGYLWASVSPGGDKIAFFAAGKGIVVTNLRGKVLAELGNYEMPCWYNNDYIVAQNATDDGHRFTSSQIMLLKADGSWGIELTPLTSMTMQPTSGGGKIVYTTIDGYLTMITIDITE